MNVQSEMSVVRESDPWDWSAPPLNARLRANRQRMNDLKHDLSEGLIEKNKSLEYVVNELNASHKISEVVNKAAQDAKTSSVKLDSMKTVIKALVDSLSAE